MNRCCPFVATTLYPFEVDRRKTDEAGTADQFELPFGSPQMSLSKKAELFDRKPKACAHAPCAFGLRSNDNWAQYEHVSFN